MSWVFVYEPEPPHRHEYPPPTQYVEGTIICCTECESSYILRVTVGKPFDAEGLYYRWKIHQLPTRKANNQ
jgi:hypothetical protein